MYRKPRFLEELHIIREEMSRECDYDVDVFAEMVRSGKQPKYDAVRNGKRVRGFPPDSEEKNEKARMPKAMIRKNCSPTFSLLLLFFSAAAPTLAVAGPPYPPRPGAPSAAF